MRLTGGSLSRWQHTAAAALLLMILLLQGAVDPSAAAVNFHALPANASVANTSGLPPCRRITGIPYCGQYIHYAINSTMFATQETIQNASDAVFDTYVGYLDNMTALLANENFNQQSWRLRCLGQIAYFHCLRQFPACIADDSAGNGDGSGEQQEGGGEEESAGDGDGGAVEAGVCQFACHDFQRLCDNDQYFYRGTTATAKFNPAGKAQLVCKDEDGPDQQCSVASGMPPPAAAAVAVAVVGWAVSAAVGAGRRW